MMDVPEANHCIPLWYLRVNSFFFRWNNGSRSAPSVDQKPWKQGNHPNNMDRIGSKGWHNLPGTFGLLKDDHLLCPPGGVSKGTCSTRTCGKFQVDVMFVCDQKISKYIIYIYMYVYYYILLSTYDVLAQPCHLCCFSNLVCSMRLSAQLGPSAHLKTSAEPATGQQVALPKPAVFKARNVTAVIPNRYDISGFIVISH